MVSLALYNAETGHVRQLDLKPADVCAKPDMSVSDVEYIVSCASLLMAILVGISMFGLIQPSPGVPMGWQWLAGFFFAAQFKLLGRYQNNMRLLALGARVGTWTWFAVIVTSAFGGFHSPPLLLLAVLMAAANARLNQQMS